jgi:cation diffusion facilitator family transporter
MTKNEESPLASDEQSTPLFPTEYGSIHVDKTNKNDNDNAVVVVKPANQKMAEYLQQKFNRSTHSNSAEWNNECDRSTASVSSNSINEDDGIYKNYMGMRVKVPTLRRLALELSLYVNLFITLIKLVTYLQTMSLSVLAALLDSILDVVSQLVLNYTEQHSSMQRSSAFYPAGASRLEPIGVLTCAALMGMASFEVLRESFTALFNSQDSLEAALAADAVSLVSFWSMVAIVVTKLSLLWLCNTAANKKIVNTPSTSSAMSSAGLISPRAVVQLADPTLEALAQDHWNDSLSNMIAAVALLCALQRRELWFLDPIGAILISFYIIHSWYMTGKEQIEQLTGKSAPEDFIEELMAIASSFDDRIELDVCRAYHFGPKFLVELEVVMPRETLLFESHDLGMELQYEIEGREEVERCFVHIDYETRDYDEHVVSKVPELREKYRPGKKFHSSQSV